MASNTGPQTFVQNRRPPRAWESKAPVLGVGDSLGAGDSYLVENILGDELSSTSFSKVKEEVKWDVMHHRGGNVPRLVAVQGDITKDGSYPIYRHPADESPPLLPFTQTIKLIRDRVQELVEHPLNHVLIQHYRSGKDYISEHSDKTIDTVRGSSIINVSLGAQRVMTLREKKEMDRDAPSSRASQRIPLPHGSMFVMGPETNKTWLHGINHDNRPLKVKSEEEKAEAGERISLTFRHIGTFLTDDEKKIFGQGATGKTKDDARDVIRGGEEGERLIQAFGRENHDREFNWDEWYGKGFDVLHFTMEKIDPKDG
uniref:Fe2OG dioxygenase domain-containing protein n=1 Tax=Moniliophthora roreri TaxID=221103 RepID=A0A0W0EVE0_MONRR